jgi:hypothetical protein
MTMIEKRQTALRKVHLAAAATGRNISDRYGLFTAAQQTPEGRLAIQEYSKACNEIARKLQGTRYEKADPEYI